MGNVRQTRSGSALFLSILLAVAALAFWRCGTEESNSGVDGGTNNGVDAGNSINNAADGGILPIGEDAGTIGGGPVP